MDTHKAYRVRTASPLFPSRMVHVGEPTFCTCVSLIQDALTLTENAQPAILCHSIATLEVVKVPMIRVVSHARYLSDALKLTVKY